ncbi:putative sodium-coupled neutral amino acid transporter 11 isoform X2 [Xiphophorus maculatus]|uniref:putative sodium-coupled neutral amino acid transporter 11 isoform X2 n=1 Tax=Xiphophorus maculatus TaxID=8083 RepID=UPI000C6DD988|nr:putative sodium-coupled neutral amino acid transporter 11 isoform X2 [Xiphophorus maculatus]
MAQQQSNEEGTALIHMHKPEWRCSMISASFNFINSIIGSGIIGLPYALNQAGLPFGLLLLMLVGFITDYSIVLLIKGGNLSGSNSYQSLVQNTFGFPGFLILSALQFLYPFIAMISYNITTGDTLTKVFQRIPGVGPDHILAERHFVILLSTFLFTLPLSLYRNIERLGKVSFLSMVLTLTILIIVMIRAATLGPQIVPTENAWAFAKWNSIQAVGVMSFGYTTFTGYTQGDIFENYCRNDNLATFGRFCFGLSIITTFPLECFVTREVLSNVICSRPLSKAEHVSITLLIVAVCTALSLAYDCLGVVLELNGALSATPLIFIIPSACYLKLCPGHWFHGEKLIPIMLIIIGLFVMITGLILIGVFPQDCSHGVEMFYCADANVSGTVPPE